MDELSYYGNAKKIPFMYSCSLVLLFHTLSHGMHKSLNPVNLWTKNTLLLVFSGDNIKSSVLATIPYI
jgi:hypothetical protein